MFALFLLLFLLCKSYENPIIRNDSGLDLNEYFGVHGFEESADAHLRRPRGCVRSIKLIYCPNQINRRRTYYYYEDKVLIDSSCEDLHVRSIIWTLLEKNTKKTNTLRKYRNKQVAIITTNDVKAGDYVLTVDIIDNDKKAYSKNCLLRYFDEPPALRFKKGFTQNVLPGAVFTVDLSASKFMVGLTPEWSVSCTNDQNPECVSAVCSFPAKGVKFTATSNPCIKTMMFTATVTYDSETVSNNQLVYVAEAATNIIISCHRNCESGRTVLTDHRTDVVLKAICSSCPDFGTLKINWEIRTSPTDVVPNPSVGVSADTKTFTIRRNTLSRATNYYVYATAPGNVLRIFRITTVPNYSAICTVSPTSGYNMETVFSMKCNFYDLYKVHIPYIEISQGRLESDDHVLARGAANDEVRFRLEGWEFPLANVEVTATLYDEKSIFVYTQTIFIDLNVKEITEAHIEHLLKQTQIALKEGDASMTTQLIKGIFEALGKKKLSNEFTLNAYGKLMEAVQMTQVNTAYDYRLIIQTASRFFEINIEDKSYGDMLTGTCKAFLKLKKSNLIILKYGVSRKSGILAEKENSDLVNNCSDHIVKMGDSEEATTEPEEEDTSQSNVIEEVIVEDYEDYDNMLDFDESKLKKLDALELLAQSSSMFADGMFPGETMHTSGEMFNKTVMRDTGKNLSNRDIVFEGIVVSTGDDLEKNYQFGDISAIVTSFERKLLDKAVLATNIAEVNFYEHFNGTTNKIHPKYNITFDVVYEHKEYAEYTVSAPADRNSWTLPSIDYKMNVHRLNMLGPNSCFVKFTNLTEDSKLQVVFTRNRRPTLQDYDGVSFTIDSSNVTSQVLPCPYNASQQKNHFLYVAVLPSVDVQTLAANADVSVNYFIQFTEQSCVSFDAILLQWKAADCKVSFIYEGTIPKILCICEHTSFHAATHKPISNKLDKVDVIEFTSMGFVNYTIFIHVAVVFAAYCLAMAFLPLRTRTLYGIDKVIFLSDNRKNDRYAYFLVVKTGNLVFSGTTSNVMVKLHGNLASSEAHVLNYPDPDKRMLQRDREDWFILTSLLYLGNIQFIELWVDVIGFRPAWFCDHVIVVDLQNQNQWYFKVDKWFTLLSENSYHAKIESSDIVQSRDKLVASLQKNVRLYLGAENTWNIFSSLQDETLTYYERLTVLLSMIYTTFAFLVIFLNPPKWKSSDAFGYARFGFHFDTFGAILGASAAANLINGPIAYFFKNSPKHKKVDSLLIQETMFSEKVAHLTWGFLCFWIAICMIYLLLFGNWVPYHTSHVWVLCSLCSLLFSALVLENVYIIISKVLTNRFKKIPKRYYDYRRILIEVERQRKVLFRMFGQLLLRPYFKKQYKKIPWSTYIRRKQFEVERSDVIAQIENMVLFLVFLVLVYILTFIGTDSSIYTANRMMEKMVTGQFSSNHTLLSTVNSTDDIYVYIKKTLIPLLHPTIWYGNYYMKDPGLMTDYNTKILGICQLRQQRRNQTCDWPGIMNDTRHYCSNKVPEIIGSFEYNKGDKISDAMGMLETYKGDGYVTHLGRTKHNSQFIFNLLKRNNWLDINTKVLFIEFWTYNPNNNIFNAVRVIIERDLSGHLVTSTLITTARLIYQSKFMEICTLVLLGALLLVICVMLGSGIWVIVKRHRDYFENVWNAFDSLLLIQALAVVALIYIRNDATLVLLSRLEESNHNSFVNYFQVFELLEINNVVMGTLLCMGTIRAWKYLRFSMVFRLMEMSIRNGANETLLVMLYQTIIFVMFAVFFCGTIGKVIQQFSHFTRSLLSVFLISINLVRGFKSIRLFYGDFLICIFYSSLLILSIVFYSLYSTIFMNSYAQSKIYFSNRRRRYNLMDYIYDEATYYSEVVKRQNLWLRLKGGTTEEVAHKFVNPKAPAQRYADAIILSEDKMTVMRLIAIWVVKRALRFGKLRTMDDEEYEITIGIIKLLGILTKPKREKIPKLLQHIFFVAKDARQAKNVTFVSNIKLLQMEYIVEKLLRRDAITGDELQETDNIHMTGDSERLEFYKNTIDLITRTIERIKVDVTYV